MNVHAAHQQASWASILGYEGEEVKAPWQKASKKPDQVWKVLRENDLDDFPSMPGPPGTERKRNTQTKVLIDYTVASRPDEILGVYMHLYPGEEVVHLEKVNDFAREKDPNHKPHTLGEWRGFQAILFMGPLHKESGRALWNTGTMSQRKRRTTRPAPDFGRFMRLRRFESLKSHATAAVADKSLMATDDWWPIRAGIEDFVANRKRTVLKSAGLVPDESMSAMKVRSTKTGKWPHITFVKRKPKPLGTEFKSVCDGRHGVMLHLEIQEGRALMDKKPFTKELGGNAAFGLRMPPPVLLIYPLSSQAHRAPRPSTP